MTNTSMQDLKNVARSIHISCSDQPWYAINLSRYIFLHACVTYGLQSSSYISSGMLSLLSFHNLFSRSMTNHFLRTLASWYTRHHHNKQVSQMANVIVSSQQEHLTLTKSVTNHTQQLMKLFTMPHVHETDSNKPHQITVENDKSTSPHYMPLTYNWQVEHTI